MFLVHFMAPSIQIVESFSLCYEKSYFFNMVQPIDLICCKMIEIIEQNFFNRADFLFRSWFSFSGQLNISADDVTHIKKGSPI